MKRLIMGIDPGRNGGVAILDADEAIALCGLPLPVLQMKGKGYELNVDKLHGLLTEHAGADGRIAAIAVERNSSHGYEGRGGLWTMAENSGEILGAFKMYQVLNPTTRLIRVRSQDWKAVVLRGVNTDDDKSAKAAGIIEARRMFPNISLRSSAQAKKDHDGISDALMIAEYGRRVFLGSA